MTEDEYQVKIYEKCDKDDDENDDNDDDGDNNPEQ